MTINITHSGVGGLPGGRQLTPGVQAALTTALAGTNNDLVFTAVREGTYGNGITVAYVDPGGATATLGIVVTNKAIVVNLGRAASLVTTTGTLLAAAIVASAAAAALVTVANAAANDGTGLVIALTATNLTGGVAAAREQGTGWETEG